MDTKKFEKPEYFVNRELSWLKFNERVLSEARDKSLPLFERLKFLSITASNLDEFFMVRVASLKDQVHAGYEKPDIAGLTPKDQLREISAQTHELVRQQYSTYNRSLLPALEKAGLHMISEHEELSDKQKEFVDRYFEDNVYPVLTPMAMDSSRPFPLIRNKTLNIGALISKKDRKKGKEVPGGVYRRGPGALRPGPLRQGGLCAPQGLRQGERRGRLLAGPLLPGHG